METKQIWVLVLGALAIALVTSVISASITGNVIKLNADKFGKYQVYTKAEVDKRISDAITIVLDDVIADEVLDPVLYLKANHTSEVLNMLNKCVSYETGDEGIQAYQSCDTICKSQSKTCIATFLYRNNLLSTDKGYLGGSCSTVWTTKNPIKDAFLDCVCCSADNTGY